MTEEMTYEVLEAENNRLHKMIEFLEDEIADLVCQVRMYEQNAEGSEDFLHVDSPREDYCQEYYGL